MMKLYLSKMIKIGYNNSNNHYGSLTEYEKPERINLCVENLKIELNNSYFIDIQINDNDNDNDNDNILELVKAVHTDEYINRIKNFVTNFIICRNCNKPNNIKKKSTLNDFIISHPKCFSCDNKFGYDNIYCYATIDTFYTYYTYDIVLEGITVIKKLLDEMNNSLIKYSFALIRPPGHHCNNDPDGFCIFNNVFIATKYAQKIGFIKVLILDIDFHHGDGTQSLIEENNDSNISFISIHGYGKNIYPKTGKISNLDKNILNIPLNITSNVKSRKYITDKYYQNILIEQVFPFISEQNPDIIIISLGFDAHCDDPLEGMNITNDTYLYLTEQLKNLNKSLLFITEGGYNINTINNIIPKMINIFI
jgi:acetoin utilization deacetylase AcuC-like enzyme